MNEKAIIILIYNTIRLFIYTELKLHEMEQLDGISAEETNENSL